MITANKEIRLTLRDKFTLLLYGLYFVLKPFYLWDSGLPQISDFIIVIMFCFYFISSGLSVRFDSNMKKLLFTGLLFSAYVLIANIIWMFILSGPTSFIITSIFYIYNFLMVLIIAVLYFDYDYKVIEVTYMATLISLIVQIIMYLVGGGFSGGRVVAGFNNPNQLGYYGLVTFALLILSSRRIKVKGRWFVLGICISAILCFSSLSKAAMLSYMGMSCFYIFSNNKNKKLKRNINIIIILSVIILYFIYQFNRELIISNGLYISVERRINSIGMDGDDNLEGRGYYRITEYPQYWIFGAGEGEYYRFNQAMEFHSTLGNIQVSYGLVGLSLFLGFIIIALQKDRFRSWYLIGFILIYGLTHNGIRNSLFWILIALISTENHTKKQEIHNLQKTKSVLENIEEKMSRSMTNV